LRSTIQQTYLHEEINIGEQRGYRSLDGMMYVHFPVQYLTVPKSYEAMNNDKNTPISAMALG